ncbi:DUF1983 domain-containing protein [Burkholderia multivorans]|uniref:phage tail fiber domain-containing protein n=3 Tax=Burkholderia multivorans TaxID=87883 RepID=UPI001B8F07C8|nr:phage tail fiber protein [Burkholderia multivorans]MBR8020778.1 DUF1983 domain-containing protein [Burkholderia multivorans]MBU9227295.1 DUF1983 domain-containing protein [Burkholderia multivorans]MBU9388490.1 DUF1983 domain-containing protein [Burkholderia multivorans]MDN8031172.1 phage tail fiber protein [Burkholderia multivorans]HEF4732929.1 DUF1983 domain-containing protein [Burkholderia multivorans]
MTFPTTYQTDGTTTVWEFDWPYLDRSDVFVTVNGAARKFSFIDDHTIKCADLYGNPFPAGLPLVINRSTPDLVSLAEFKDAAKLTAEDLNRARLQCLFLIQERSGGMAGAVGTVISNMTNEIETISGALNDLSYMQGVLTAGLAQFDGLNERLTKVENGAKALLEQIQQEIDNRTSGESALYQRMDSMDLKVGNLAASVRSDITLLQTSNEVLAAKTDQLSAHLDALDTPDGGEELAASIISAAITQVKQDSVLSKKVETLEAKMTSAIDGKLTEISALVQTEQEARVKEDEALAAQIATLQSQIGDNLATVVQDMRAQIDATNGKVSGLEAQYTLKAQVKRDDGTIVMGGIGVAATANDNYVGSKIALMANGVVFCDPNNANGPLVPFLESGIVDGSPTLVVPSARVGDKTLPGRVLVDGAVEARTIKANSITGDKLVAGSISTDKLQVGLGANLLKNSTFVNLQGWATWSAGGGTGDLVLDQPDWFPTGGHAAAVRSVGVWGSTDPNAILVGLYSEKVPVVGGSYYEFSGYVGVHRCAANVGIEWYDANGAMISANGYGAPGTATTVGQAAGGKALAGYVRIGGIAKAPANAASALIQFHKGMNVSPDTDSWMFVTQPMIAETSSSATRLSPYTPSGLGTLITPAGISTPSLSALSANIGLLRTAASGARTEISNNLIQTFDANNVLRIRLGVWG